MPSGPQKRKSTRRKKAAKPDRRPNSSNAPHSRHVGESDGEQQYKSAHPQVKVENYTEGSSSLTPETTTQKSANEKQAKIETNKPSNSTKQAKIKIYKAAMMELEPPTVADYLCQPFKSSPEKETHKVKDLGFKAPTFVDPVKPVDQSLVEVASQLNNNNTKIQEKDDLEHTVINETDSKSNQLSKENEVQKLDSPKSKENSLQDYTNGKCPYCGSSSDDERQPLLALAPERLKRLHGRIIVEYLSCFQDPLEIDHIY